jgi:DNA adenine methylase
MAVAESYCERAFFSDIDSDVAVVWQCALSRDALKFAKEVEEFNLTKQHVRQLFYEASNGATQVQRALAVLVRNRISRGGVLAEGAGRLKKGENGKGIRSRWYPETLGSRLRVINKLRRKLHFSKSDGFSLLRKFSRDKTAVAFVDPPYHGPANRLYKHWRIDHEMLFRSLSTFEGDFLLAYDDALEIRNLARKYKFEMAAIQMKTTHHRMKREILLSKDLHWLLNERLNPDTPWPRRSKLALFGKYYLERYQTRSQ